MTAPGTPSEQLAVLSRGVADLVVPEELEARLTVWQPPRRRGSRCA